MLDYIYDGTFDGLLTVIYHHYYTDQAAGIWTQENYQPNFLVESRQVRTETDKADRVYRAIRQKISEYDLRGVYRAFLSCDPCKEMIILNYLVLGFKQGHRVSSLHGDPVVSSFQGILKKISRESERMLQFVRFTVLEGDLMYARIEPDNDIIELAAGHFADRFRNDPFIIHDVGRNKAVISRGGRWLISAFAPEDLPGISESERSCRQLWKQYFDHIAIMERKNTRCQNNFIPDRYRKHLTEITERSEESFFV